NDSIPPIAAPSDVGGQGSAGRGERAAGHVHPAPEPAAAGAAGGAGPGGRVSVPASAADRLVVLDLGAALQSQHAAGVNAAAQTVGPDVAIDDAVVAIGALGEVLLHGDAVQGERALA